MTPLRTIATAVAALVAAFPRSAFAASQYFPQLTTGITIIEAVVEVLCAAGLIVLLGALVWEYTQTKRIGYVITEVLGAIVVVIIAFNGPGIANAIGLSAATIRP